VDSFVNRCSELTYIIEHQANEDSEGDDLKGIGKNSANELDFNSAALQNMDFDDVDRITNETSLWSTLCFS